MDKNFKFIKKFFSFKNNQKRMPLLASLTNVTGGRDSEEV